MRCAIASALVAVGCGRVDFDAARLDAASTVAPDGALAQGLVAWYRFDEGSGLTVTDSSGRGNNGNTGPCGFPYPTWGPGRIGTAMQFSATRSNCVAVPESANLELAGAWTVSAWVAPSSLPAAGQAYALVVKPNGISQHNYALFLDHGYIGAPNLGWTAAFHDVNGKEWSSSVTAAISIGAWSHVAATWDTASLVVYVDGAAVATTMPGLPPSASPFLPGPSTLLARNQCCAQYLDGALDEVRIYSRALSSSEIQTLYATP
jgi:hypothetical protein